MPHPSVYAKQITQKSVVALYEEAENALKIIERINEELVIPSINQLRYAGHHLAQYLNNSDKDELVKAANHCKRSIYDSYEIGIYYFLSEIKEFEKDYKNIVISSVIKDWVDIKKKINNIEIALIPLATDKEKEDRYSHCDQFFKEMLGIVATLKASRDELNKVIKKERGQSFIVLIAGLTFLLALLTYFGLNIIYQSPSSSTNNQAPNVVPSAKEDLSVK